ncbi:unannotated protein [freshwater metagenome]|uniref:Unannotated protein n=1 Tax=freshwater metagenome TaxID=449393 RepID=A0A6J6ZC18_9ZZZZ
MAVHGVDALVVAEAHRGLDGLARVEAVDVLAAAFEHAGRVGLRRALARQDAAFLVVRVDRVRPGAAAVLVDPHLGGAFLHFVGRGIAVVRDAVRVPGAVAPAPDPLLALGRGDHDRVGQRTQRRAVDDLRARVRQARARGLDDELERILARGQQLARRSAAARLLATVGHEDLRARLELREVDDHVETLAHAMLEVRHVDRARQQVAVVGDDRHRQVGRTRRALAHPPPEEAARAAVVNADAVLARLHLEVRLDRAVHRVLVADRAIQAREREEVHAPRVELAVVEHHRHVELVREAGCVLRMAREAQARGPRNGLVAGIDFVIDRGRAEQARVHVLRGEVVLVVVVPQRAERLAVVAAHAGAGGHEALVDARVQVRVVVVPEPARVVVVQRAAIALGRRVVVVQVRAHGRGAKAQRGHRILRRGGQFVVDARQVRAAVLQAEQDPAHARAGRFGHAGGLACQEGPIDVTPGRLARKARRHVRVPDVVMLDGADLVDVFRRIEQARVLVGAVPGLVRQVGVRRGGCHLRVLVQQAQLGVHRIARRRRGLAAAEHHRVGELGHAVLHRVGPLGLFEAHERVLERRGLRADHVHARDRAGHGRGAVGRAHAQARDGQQHAGAGAQHAQFEEVATIEPRAGQFALGVHRALDQSFLLLVHACSFKKSW